MFHEPFHTTRAGVVLVAHTAAQFFLDIECQALFRSSRQVMQMAANRPKKVFCLGKTLYVGCGQYASLLQVLGVGGLVEVLSDPKQGLQIT